MSEPCVRLTWDSEFFGVPIARVSSNRLTETSANAVDQWASSQQIACMYFVASADDQQAVQVAQSRGYQLVDIRLTFERKLPEAMPSSGDGTIRNAVEADLPALEQIAAEAHRDTRFYYDGNFSRSACDGLYRTWIRNSFRGYAEAVLVTGELGNPSGYITAHVDRAGDEGNIGLIAVKASQRGQRLGGKLVNAAIEWFAGRKLGAVSVVTQGRNVVAQRLYQQCGFITRSIQLYYHKWYKPVPATSPRI